jgi:hypothetical protein
VRSLEAALASPAIPPGELSWFECCYLCYICFKYLFSVSMSGAAGAQPGGSAGLPHHIFSELSNVNSGASLAKLGAVWVSLAASLPQPAPPCHSLRRPSQ